MIPPPLIPPGPTITQGPSFTNGNPAAGGFATHPFGVYNTQPPMGYTMGPNLPFHTWNPRMTRPETLMAYWPHSPPFGPGGILPASSAPTMYVFF
jgi:hypothetical protein